MKKSLKKTFFGLFIIIPSIFLVFFYMTYNKALSFEEGAFVDVSPGESLNSVISNLEDRYGFDKEFQTKFIMRVLSIEDNITIGRHDLSNVRTVKDLTRNLTSATIHTSITLLEGWSINEISRYLSKHKDLKIFNGEVWEAERAKSLGLIDDIGTMESILEKKFGDDIKYKYINKKKSFFSRFSSSVANELISKIVENKYFSRLGL